jgi:hypothetical protein
MHLFVAVKGRQFCLKPEEGDSIISLLLKIQKISSINVLLLNIWNYKQLTLLFITLYLHCTGKSWTDKWDETVWLHPKIINFLSERQKERKQTNSFLSINMSNNEKKKWKWKLTETTENISWQKMRLWVSTNVHISTLAIIRCCFQTIISRMLSETQKSMQKSICFLAFKASIKMRETIRQY